jgi:glycosyltransferase involved in cell wall biosynthesis
VPAFNEEAGLAVVLRKLLQSVDDDCEVIVVDDGSVDATATVARGFPVRLVQHERNRGKGVALKTGIEHATGDIIIWIDADDTYPPDVIPRMIEALSGAYDLVYTTRSRTNIPVFNRFAAGFFSWTARTVYGFKPPDAFSGLCGVRKQHLQRMHLDATGFAIEVEVAMKAGRMNLRMLDLPIEYGSRIGTSKLNGPRAGAEIALHLLRYLRWRPKD